MNFATVMRALCRSTHCLVFCVMVWIVDMNCLCIGDENDAEMIDSVIVYGVDEKNVSCYEDSYCNVSIEALVKMIARNRQKESLQPRCRRACGGAG